MRRQARKACAYFGFPLELENDGGQSTMSWGVLARNPRFRWYFAGSVTSDFGTWTANTSQVLLAYQLSHSVLFVGLITCAQFISPLLFGPCAGLLTDRVGGRRMLLATQFLAAAFAALMAGLAMVGPINKWWLTVGAVGSGIAFTLALPARNVTVRRLVTSPDTKAAFALDSVSYNLGRTVAPALSALSFSILGFVHDVFGTAFAVNAASFLVFAACLMMARPGPEADDVQRNGGKRSHLRDGFVTAGRDWRIFVLLLMVASVTMADDPVLVLGPRIASQAHAAPVWSGIFIAALGAGTVCGSFLPVRPTMSLRSVASALAVLAGCMVLFVLSPVAWSSALGAFGAGVACLVANASTRAQLARHAGPAQEAGVMAVWAIAWAGSKPLASLADGAIAHTLGLKWAGVTLALPALIPVLVMLVLATRFYLNRGKRLGADSAPPDDLRTGLGSPLQDSVKRASELLRTP